MKLKINKYKKLKNGMYQVTLENESSLVLYEEVILKYEILLKSIDTELLKEINLENSKWDVYYSALKQLKVRAKSKKEIISYLKKKEYNIKFINKAVDKLEGQGYINDLVYAKSFLNMQLLTTSRGPLKIRQELIKKGIADEVIDEVLTEYTDEIEQEKIEKIISKKIKSNHNKGKVILIKKIKQELINNGFNYNIINSKLSDIDINDDKDIIKKEYNKLYQKLSKKYSGSELEYKIKQKMYQKGFLI